MSLSLSLSPMAIALGRQEPSHSLDGLVTSGYIQGLLGLENLSEWLFRDPTVPGAQPRWSCHDQEGRRGPDVVVPGERFKVGGEEDDRG